MKDVALGELVAPAMVKRAGSNDYPVLSMTMHDGLVAQAVRFHKRIASADTSDYKVVTHGQLVVGFPINEAVLDFQLQHEAAVVSPAYGIWDLRDESIADRNYLKRFLKSPRAIEYYVGKMKGSTARRRSLPPAEFNAMPIPLPSLPEQRRIAAILDHADALRAKRRQVLAHLGALTESIFEEFFRQEPDGWFQLSELAEKVVVGHVGPTSEFFRPDGVPFLRTGNVGHGEIVREGLAHITTEFHQRLTKSQIRRGDVLISRVITHEVRAAVAPEDLDGANCANIIVVRPSERLLSSTILGYLSRAGTQRQLIERRVGSAQRVVNTGVLKELSTPTYSVERQRTLAARVEAVSARRAVERRAMKAEDELFASLQSRAFRGDL